MYARKSAQEESNPVEVRTGKRARGFVALLVALTATTFSAVVVQVVVALIFPKLDEHPEKHFNFNRGILMANERACSPASCFESV